MPNFTLEISPKFYFMILDKECKLLETEVECSDKKDDDMNQELESSEIVDGEDMNEDAPNPDLEWETTAIAEAKKRAEIKSNIPYNNPLLTHLYIDCKIVDRVVKAWEENEGEEPRRKGYMGHLTRIANTMVSRGRFLYKYFGRFYNIRNAIEYNHLFFSLQF